MIIDAIRELSPNSAAGPDGIPSSLLINCASEIAPLLRKLFTASFLKGYIPSSFKRAAIVPIFKSGDKFLLGNYRPISLTSVICKVYERIIRKQVFSFLCDKNCLNDTQHGFRSGRSCLSALLDVYDDVMHMLNGDSIVDMFYRIVRIMKKKGSYGKKSGCFGWVTRIKWAVWKVIWNVVKNWMYAV